MQVYLTGINSVKYPKKNKKENVLSGFSLQKHQEKDKSQKQIDKDNNVFIEEDISSEIDRINKINSKVISNRKYHSLKKTLSNKQFQKKDNENNINNINNNFISSDDKNKKNKKNFLCVKDFNLMRSQNTEIKKFNEKMANEIKEEYLEYIMLKEQKYADFNKISEDYRKKIYISFQKYNNNLLIIASKKEEHKKLLSEIEKSLINNYYLKDSSMLPIYDQLIEKVKIDILTKQQEHDGYHKIYEELYNKNYIINRKVLDEIDIDRTNENFYDQYKILKNHAIVQVSKKQDTLNQIEEYQKKILEDHDKELKQKNKILKDLKLQIEVFKEDEKDLVNKLKKLKSKREQITKFIKENERKIKEIEDNIMYHIKKYQKSYISMNKIFKSVNAKNLDDVLLDVDFIKSKFNKLKNNIINKNLNISKLNSDYTKLEKNLNDVKKRIIIIQQKNNTIFSQQDQKRLIEIKNELKKIKENEYKIKEILQSNIGIFQQGIAFIFQKLKLLITNIAFLKNEISPKLSELINKYKNIPLTVNFEKIDEELLRNFTFLFFQFSNIIFYLSLQSMSSGLNINNVNKNNLIIPMYNKQLLHIYQDGIKKALKEYSRRAILKHEKQKEININTKNKEKEKKVEDKINFENKTITQNQMFKRFVDYLHNKDMNSFRENQKERLSNNNKNSFFFTGIDSIKQTNSKNYENSSKYIDTKNKYDKIKNPNKEMSISLRLKEEFLQRNKNKVINMFSKYQNTLVKEIDKNYYYQKKHMKKIPFSHSQERAINKKNYIRNEFMIENKRKNILKEENSEGYTVSPNLLDENYEYDEDDNEEEKKRKISFKKNKTYSNFSFFKLNKDRANIYKKMNDLRKLQMAYFGGRFLNTKINSGMSTSYGGNIFDEFVSNFIKKQNQQSDFGKKNDKRKLNFGKKLVAQISANQKLNNRTTTILKNPSKIKNNHLITMKNRNKFNEMNNNMKTSFSVCNKRTSMGTINNERSIYRYKKIDNKKNIYSRSTNNYKTISIKKNNTKNGDRSEISNYFSKKS